MKKVLAVIFLLFGALLALSLVAQIPKLISTIINTEGSGYSVAYSIGSTGSFMILGGITYIFFTYGIRWLKQGPKAPATTLDEEFKIENK